nr:MAG TPA: hypothetical protein [Caudoviricetes sp.]
MPLSIKMGQKSHETCQKRYDTNYNRVIKNNKRRKLTWEEVESTHQ